MEDAGALGRGRLSPYFHDGASPTLESAIQRHRGDAKLVTTKYQELSAEDQAAVVAFLQTLKAPFQEAK